MVKDFKNRLARYLSGGAPSPFGMLSRSGKRRSSRGFQRLVCTESCESRAMLSGTAAAAPKALLGTNGNDVFTLKYNSLATSGNVTATISSNGGPTTNLGSFSMASGIALQGFGGNDSVRIVGTSGNDVFVMSNAGLKLNGSPLRISTIESVSMAAGAGNDTYRFDADAQLGRVTVDDSAGWDSLDFSLTTSANVRVNLSLASVQTVNTNLRLTLNTSTGIENVIGGHGDDRLTGNSRNNVLRGGAGTDWLSGMEGSDSLYGGAGDDKYVFRSAATAELDTIVELAGEGTDTVDFTSVKSGVRFNLALTGTQNVHTNQKIRMGGIAGTENVTGGPGDDTLTGNARANILNGGAGDDQLTGGGGNDTYVFRASTTAETDTIVEAAAGGRDTLDFSAITTAVVVNLSSTQAQTTNAKRRLVFNTSGTIENATGGSGNDRLTGSTAANVLIGGSGNDLLEGGRGNDRLIGGAGNDNYIFRTAATSEIDTIVETSTGGFDSLNFGSISKNVTVDLSVSTLQAVHVNRSLILQAGTNIESITGGSGNDRLTGNARANVLRGSTGNDTLIGGAGSDRLIGGLGNDTYVFRNAVSAETDTVEESASGGTDTLFFGSVTKNVHVYLGTTDTQAVYTNMQLKLSSLLDVENVTGGSGDDTITGNPASNVLVGGAGSDSLLGREGNDTYVFRTAASAEFDSITELSGAGRDTLDFSAITTAVTLNLGTTTAQTSHTNRRLKLNLGTSVENVIGGSGNDNITGNAVSNVLVGNAGNDRLSGLAGRDILIGGLGLDQLPGGDGEDILIAGRTTVDLLATRLVSLQTGWNSAVSYNDRVDNLRAGIGSPTVSLRAKVNVVNDGAQKDTLTGGAGIDWYFRALDDVIVGLVAGEEINLL